MPIVVKLESEFQQEGHSMKKSLFIAAAAAVFIITAFTACKFTNTASESIAAPEIKSEAVGITLSISVPSGTSYINVYRKNITASGDQVNIGEIRPAGTSLPSSVMFTDPYAVSGVEYSYRVRFNISGSYKISNWTEKTAGLVPVTAPVYTGPAEFLYIENEATVTLTADVTAPAAGTFTPRLALASSSRATLFEMSGITSGTKLYLRSILSADYLDTPLSELGIVGQVQTKSETGTYTQYYWTEPLSVPFTDGTNTLSTITVPSSANADGGDYTSPSASVAVSAAEEAQHDYF